LLLNLFVISLVVKYHRSVLPYSWLKLSFQCTLFTPLVLHSIPSVLGCANVHTFSFSQTFFNVFLQVLNNPLNISKLFFILLKLIT